MTLFMNKRKLMAYILLIGNDKVFIRAVKQFFSSEENRLESWIFYELEPKLVFIKNNKVLHLCLLGVCNIVFHCDFFL